jgi:hypothetical protein
MRVSSLDMEGVDGWMGGWVDGWVGGWVDGWMGRGLAFGQVKRSEVVESDPRMLNPFQGQVFTRKNGKSRVQIYRKVTPLFSVLLMA